jgi:hypothetical protein
MSVGAEDMGSVVVTAIATTRLHVRPDDNISNLSVRCALPHSRNFEPAGC